MADETVDMDGLANTRFWITWDLATALRVSLPTAYRALVECDWNVEAARRTLETPCAP